MFENQKHVLYTGIGAIVLWLIKTVYNYCEESEIREKEEKRILALQIQYNVIHEAREKLKDYYDNLTYIRYDIEEIQILALKPFPKEIDQYRPF